MNNKNLDKNFLGETVIVGIGIVNNATVSIPKVGYKSILSRKEIIVGHNYIVLNADSKKYGIIHITELAKKHIKFTWKYLDKPKQPNIANAKKPDTPEQAIKDAIFLLEDQQYAMFLKRFLHPKATQEIQRRGIFTQLLRAFMQNEAKAVLERLKLAQKQAPVMTENGTQANFKIAKGQYIRLSKVGGKWYVKMKKEK